MVGEIIVGGMITVSCLGLMYGYGYLVGKLTEKIKKGN